MDVEPRLPFGFDRERQIREARVQEITARRRDERERVAPRQLGRRLHVLARRSVGGQRIETHLRRSLAVELAFSRRRREAALGKRRIAFGYREALPAARLHCFPVYVAHARLLRSQRLSAHVLVGIVEAGILEAHPLREEPEHLDVGLRLAERRDRWIV